MTYQPAASAASSGQGATRQFISFTIGAEEYGVEIMAIREIKGWTTTTALPDTPAYMRGVLDLRGAIIPIVDLRARFGGGLTVTSSRHVIMVVAVAGREIGILVDAVADIITVPVSAIQPIPELDHAHHAALLAGIVSVEGRMVALLDLLHLLQHPASAAIAAAVQELIPEGTP